MVGTVAATGCGGVEAESLSICLRNTRSAQCQIDLGLAASEQELEEVSEVRGRRLSAARSKTPQELRDIHRCDFREIAGIAFEPEREEVIASNGAALAAVFLLTPTNSAAVPATKCSHNLAVCFSESFECFSRT